MNPSDKPNPPPLSTAPAKKEKPLPSPVQKVLSKSTLQAKPQLKPQEKPEAQEKSQPAQTVANTQAAANTPEQNRGLRLARKFQHLPVFKIKTLVSEVSRVPTVPARGEQTLAEELGIKDDLPGILYEDENGTEYSCVGTMLNVSKVSATEFVFFSPDQPRSSMIIKEEKAQHDEHQIAIDFEGKRILLGLTYKDHPIYRTMHRHPDEPDQRTPAWFDDGMKPHFLYYEGVRLTERKLKSATVLNHLVPLQTKDLSKIGITSDEN